jgi:hypothetical protein
MAVSAFSSILRTLADPNDSQTERRPNVAPALVHTNPAIGGKGPGTIARAWLRSIGLHKGELLIAEAMVWNIQTDWHVWPSRETLMRKTGYGRTQVQKIKLRLIAQGVLIEDGMAWTGGKRTRRYRVPVGEQLVPAEPSAARRRKERKVSFQTGQDQAPERTESVLSNPFERTESDPNTCKNMSTGARVSGAIARERAPVAVTVQPANLTGAAREPLPYHGVDRLNRIYAAHGLAPTDRSRA